MNSLIPILAALSLSQAPKPAEQAAQRMADVLRPSVSAGLLLGQPRPSTEYRNLLPGSIPPRFSGTPPAPWVKQAKAVLPSPPLEGPPLVTYVPRPVVPEEITLPTTALLALPSIDPNVIPTLPIYARPLPDRAPLSDATLDASVSASLATPIPLRQTPVPFASMNLPDPFELQKYIRLAKQPEESSQPMAVPPHILVAPLQPPPKK